MKEIDSLKLANTIPTDDDKTNMIAKLVCETADMQRRIEDLLQENTEWKLENEKLHKELKDKPDMKWTLTTSDGQELTIIQSERIDMQVELNKSIEELQKINKSHQKLNGELRKEIERLNDIICERNK